MKNKYLNIFFLIVMLLPIVQCATRSSSVAPVAVPSSNYAGLTCEETKTMFAQKTAAKNALVNSQNNAATGDAIFVFLLLLPLSSIFGADVEGELAQAKGEVMALQGAVTINCKKKQ